MRVAAGVTVSLFSAPLFMGNALMRIDHDNDVLALTPQSLRVDAAPLPSV